MFRALTLAAALFAFIPAALAQQTPATRRVPVITSDLDYQSGLRDRNIWENWFGSLPPSGSPGGAFTLGATYYAEHRSHQTIDCTEVAAGNISFRDGCLHAYQFLTPVDVKRVTNTQYWYGWNRVAPNTYDALNEGLNAVLQAPSATPEPLTPETASNLCQTVVRSTQDDMRFDAYFDRHDQYWHMIGTEREQYQFRKCLVEHGMEPTSLKAE
jgi:hypothetical protein